MKNNPTDMERKATPDYILAIRKSGNEIVRPDHMNAIMKEIFEKCNISSVPVDVRGIARKFGFEIFYGKFADETVYGAMWDGDREVEVGDCHKSKRFILINKEDDEPRKSFTIAHELGHFVMHCRDNRNFFERYHSDPEAQNSEMKKMEDDADFFAANMVLPSSLVIGYITNNKWASREEMIQKLCCQFVVERDTVERRLKELGIE